MKDKRIKIVLVIFSLIIFYGIALFLLSQLSLKMLNVAYGISFYFFPPFFVGLGVLNLIYWFGKYQSKSTEISQKQCVTRAVLPFAIMFLFGILQWVPVGGLRNSKARAEVREIMDHMDSEKIVVTVDGKTVDQPNVWFEAIKSVQRVTAHHSHSENRVTVVITDSKVTLTFKVGQDSNVKDEYWVYYPTSYLKSYYEIGRIYSDELESN